MKRGLIKWLVRLAMAFCIVIVIILCLPLPEPLFDTPYATVLNDKEDRLLAAHIAQDEQWRFPELLEVPKKFKTCILLYEDEYFYRHPGINPISLLRATRQNIKAGRIVSGGSTLTMQVIRMALGNRKRTFGQKVYEMALSLKLELFKSKNEILNYYASQAPFGGNVVGLEAAAWRYFNRPPDQLSWSEAAVLAVLPNNPSSIYPGKNEGSLLEKRNYLIDKLFEKGYINERTAHLAKAEELPQKPYTLPQQAPHALYRLIKEKGQGKVFSSTIDYDLQNRVNQLVKNHHSQLTSNNIHNSAAIVVDIQTGEVRAYVGNVQDYSGLHGADVDVISAPRSTGSILKPFLYALAMEKGVIAPNQLLPDIPVFYDGFSPTNFDKSYHGAVPADQALASSLNVPFVHLLREYGLENFHAELIKMGITTLDQPASHYGLSLILGGAEANLWDITAAYAGLGRLLTRDELKRPDVFFSNSLIKKSRVSQAKSDIHLGKLASWNTLQAMQALVRPFEETGWQRFRSSKKLAWKTGTSIGFRDAWAVGLNGRYVIGVWAGNADGEGRAGLTGVTSAAPLLFQIADLLEARKFDQPYGSFIQVCAHSGMPIGENCSYSRKVMVGKTDQLQSCTFHKIVHLDQSREYQVNSTCYNVAEMVDTSWFVLPPVQSWYYKQFNSTYNDLPDFLNSCSSSEENSRIELIYPGQFTRIFIPRELNGESGRVVFEAAHRNPEATIFWHIDGDYVGTTTHLHQLGLNLNEGKHQISLIDAQGNSTNQSFEILN